MRKGRIGKMEYVIILLTLWLVALLLKILFDYNLKKIKQEVKNEELDKIVQKYPENKVICEAFAGESQARNKYTYFASKAKKEGYEQIAAIFQETADNEKEHAKLWKKSRRIKWK